MIWNDPVKVGTAREFHCNANHGRAPVSFCTVVRRIEGQGGTMKAKLYVLAAALVLSVVATSTSHAQQYTLSVKIPFAFQAGDHTLPAGEYVVDSTISGTRMIQRLRQVDGNAMMVVMTIPVEARNGHAVPELVFNCYGETKFLSQIWTGDNEGRQLSKSNREKRAAIGEGGREIALLLQPAGARP
jgi:hypothetical protein